MTLRGRDLGKLKKETSDILMNLGVTDDDRQIVDQRLAWSDEIAEPVKITIKEIKDELPVC